MGSPYPTLIRVTHPTLPTLTLTTWLILILKYRRRRERIPRWRILLKLQKMQPLTVPLLRSLKKDQQQRNQQEEKQVKMKLRNKNIQNKLENKNIFTMYFVFTTKSWG